MTLLTVRFYSSGDGILMQSSGSYLLRGESPSQDEAPMGRQSLTHHSAGVSAHHSFHHSVDLLMHQARHYQVVDGVLGSTDLEHVPTRVWEEVILHLTDVRGYIRK